MDEETREILESLPEATDIQSDEIPRLTFTNYSEKRYVRRANGILYGRWTSSMTGACHQFFENQIVESAVIQLRKIGKCPNNEDVLMCEHH